MKKLVVFDLDYTLINFNSHYYIADYLINNNVFLRFIYAIVVNKVFSFIFRKATKKDLKRTFSVYLLQFFTEEIIRETINNKLSNIESFYNHEVFALFESFRSDPGCKTVIISGTINQVADFVADKFQVDVYSSVISGGKYLYDIQGKKLICVEKNYSDYEKFYFVSDNFEDINDQFENYIFVYDGLMYKRCNETFDV